MVIKELMILRLVKGSGYTEPITEQSIRLPYRDLAYIAHTFIWAVFMLVCTLV